MRFQLSIIFLIAAVFGFSACGGNGGSSVNDPQSGNLALDQGKSFFLDSDGDGFGDPNQSVQGQSAPAGYVDNNKDCNDGDKQINPSATTYENKDTAVDFNCDGIFSWIPGKTIHVNLVSGKKTLTVHAWDAAARTLKIEKHESDSPDSAILEVFEFIYDASGNILSHKAYEQGVLTSSNEKSYDGQGRVVSEKLFNEGVTSFVETAYDQNTSIFKRYAGADANAPISSSGKSSFDAQGNVLSSESHRGDLDTEVTAFNEYKYDQGNLISRVAHQGNQGGRITLIESYVYEQGKKSTFLRVNTLHEGSPAIVSSEKYYYEGNVEKVEKHNLGGLNSPISSAEERSYDEQGRLMTFKIHGRGGFDSPVTRSTEEFYDENGSFLASRVSILLGGQLSEFEATGNSDFIPVQQPRKK